MIKKVFKLFSNNITILKDINKSTDKNIIVICYEILKYKIKYKINIEDYLSFQFYNMKDEEVATFFTYKMNDKLVDRFNDKKKKLLFNNKEEFNKIFADYLGRDWIRSDVSYEDFLEFINGKTAIFYKKIDGRRGIGARKYILNDYKDDYKKLYQEISNLSLGIVEDVVVPHKLINDLCDTGLSTIRVVTLNNNGKLVLLDSVFMITNGSIVNCEVTGGGLSACIDVNTGIVITDGVDVKRNFYIKHPISGKTIKGIQIPYWHEVLNIISEIYNKVSDVNYIGWDIAITDNGPIVIEGNASWPSHRIWQIPYLREKKGKKSEVLAKIYDKSN